MLLETEHQTDVKNNVFFITLGIRSLSLSVVSFDKRMAALRDASELRVAADSTGYN